jgi:hypothetical protein
VSQVEVQELEEGIEVGTPSKGSLADRMAARREQTERVTTEKFEVPRFEGVLSVELRLIGWKKLRSYGQRHSRMRDSALQELYVAADQLLAATVGFYEDEEVEGIVNHRKAPGKSWVSLLNEMQTARKEPVSDEITPRQALIALVGDTNVMFLWEQWQEWMKGERPDVDKEVQRDFQTTP